MPIITSRTNENARIMISEELCNSCGLCVKVCTDFSLLMVNGKPEVSDHPLFGCMACGQCMAVCPTKAIEVWGREMSGFDRIDLPDKNKKATYEQITSLMIGRRSIRHFRDKQVEEEVVNKIIQAALTAPMGIPPSDVQLVVFKGREKVREFSFDVIDYFKKVSWLFSKRGIWLWRLFGKEAYEVMKSFGEPLVSFMVKTRAKEENYLLYDAPLAMYFMASSYCDPADPYIPATYAMLAAESMGLGTCMIGSVHPIIQHGAKQLKKKWQLPPKSPAGLIVLFGYPKYKYSSAIRRSFAGVTVWKDEERQRKQYARG